MTAIAPEIPFDSHGMPTATRDACRPIYLRVGTWNPASPYSGNYARGEREAGLSVYDLKDGQPVIPEESEWAEVDMLERLRSDQPKFLVQGLLVGEGHDGEPLLGNVVVVGLWQPEAQQRAAPFSV